MRLLSFLSDIEKSLLAESPALDHGAWDTSRMVNFHHSLARLTLAPRPGNELSGGSIFLQAFNLADGSLCLKANLNWNGNAASTVLAIYSKPKMNWKLEASRVSGTWLEGPRKVADSPQQDQDLRPLVAVA